MSASPVALLAYAEDANEEEAMLTRRAAIALVRAALERGRRVLVHADPETILDIALAAAELRGEAAAEGEASPPPGLLLLPLPPGKSEDVVAGFFDPSDDGDEDGEDDLETEVRESLADSLAALGVLDLGSLESRGRFSTSPETFRDLFASWEPQAVVALGPEARLQPALDAAEWYQNDRFGVRLFSTRATSSGDPIERYLWKSLESLVPSEEAEAPPVLDGEPVRDEGAIGQLARRVDLETLLALAMEQLAVEEDGGGEGSRRAALVRG